MANEELAQRRFLENGILKGNKFGGFEEVSIGSTRVDELRRAGLDTRLGTTPTFTFQKYKAPRNADSTKPDQVFFRRVKSTLTPIAVAEHKSVVRSQSANDILKAAEQALFAASVVGAPIAVSWEGDRPKYIDVKASIAANSLTYYAETRDLNPGVLSDLVDDRGGEAKDPAPLAEAVWQLIWHATKEEPKQCLLTFVEVFMLKFLSDNLPLTTLPERYRFYVLTEDPNVFRSRYGQTAIEYYVTSIRPFIKTLFPDNSIARDPTIAEVFALETIVSKTSIINGFAFLRSSATGLSSNNLTFLDILAMFEAFGSLTRIDPEFKLRLYETFLRRSARQQKLGQFFTPRNVVKSLIKMARLETLAEGSVVLDPAAGVGGFVLEPSLVDRCFRDNISFSRGEVSRKIKFVGVDVDANTHVLAKANTLIHNVELIRNPTVTLAALNQLMAETFVLMNHNDTLGSLENPPMQSVDVILTNPPYVTRGSAVYREVVKQVGKGQNGVDLKDHYDRSGLGVESYFVRYVSAALKAGGRAFIIVPLGLLNRTEPFPKSQLLKECNILASIALPRNTFFNTAHLRLSVRKAIYCSRSQTGCFLRTCADHW